MAEKPTQRGSYILPSLSGVISVASDYLATIFSMIYDVGWHYIYHGLGSTLSSNLRFGGPITCPFCVHDLHTHEYRFELLGGSTVQVYNGERTLRVQQTLRSSDEGYMHLQVLRY